MFEIAWKEIDRKMMSVTKRKAFKTEAAMNRFIEKLFEKDNFQMILGYREV